MDYRDELLEQALALSPEDRAFIAIALENSLTALIGHSSNATDLPATPENATFLAELQRRSAAYRAGETTARPATQVLADLRRRQAGEAMA